ncbi:MAG TPA: hypothetical protein VN829_08980 [Dongiaceae bacterium]|nr:hypothetical protein [Dongiaceae bacterium]
MASLQPGRETKAADSRASFFQQSSWMMIATVASGILMSLVHTLSKRLPNAEYAAFGALLPVLLWMGLPAIVIMASSLTAVMFPKVVAGLARGRKTDVVAITLVETLALGVLAAEGLRVAAPLAIRILSKPEYASILPLIHRYALAQVPLTLATVLLARGKFRCVPWLATVAFGYWEALQHFHSSFGTVITILGCANLALLATCVVFRQMERPK